MSSGAPCRRKNSERAGAAALQRLRPERVYMDNGQVPKTIKYGSLPDQAGDLYLPSTPHPPVICLLHGGFLRASFGPGHMALCAPDRAPRGFAASNRVVLRVGEPICGLAGPLSGWPGGALTRTGFFAP